jgi:hypothetical protein
MQIEKSGKGYAVDGKEHAHLGGALMHVAGAMEPKSSHMHLTTTPAGHTTHHVHEGAEAKGPHHHSDIGHMLMHTARQMGEGEDHLHVMREGETMKAHTVSGDNRVGGPHEHSSMDEVADCPDCGMEK